MGYYGVDSIYVLGVAAAVVVVEEGQIVVEEGGDRTLKVEKEVVLQGRVDYHYLADEGDRDCGLDGEKLAVPIVDRVTVRFVAVEAVGIVVVAVVVVVGFEAMLVAYDSGVGAGKAAGLEMAIEGSEVPEHRLLGTSEGGHLEEGVQRPGVECR